MTANTAELFVFALKHMGIIQIVGVTGSHPIAICLLAVVVFDFSTIIPCCWASPAMLCVCCATLMRHKDQNHLLNNGLGFALAISAIVSNPKTIVLNEAELIQSRLIAQGWKIDNIKRFRGTMLMASKEARQVAAYSSCELAAWQGLEAGIRNSNCPGDSSDE